MGVDYGQPARAQRFEGRAFRDIVAEDYKGGFEECVGCGAGGVVEEEAIWARVQGDVEGEGLIDVAEGGQVVGREIIVVRADAEGEATIGDVSNPERISYVNLIAEAASFAW